MHIHKDTGQALTTRELLQVPEIRQAFLDFYDYLVEKYRDRIVSDTKHVLDKNAQPCYITDNHRKE